MLSRRLTAVATKFTILHNRGLQSFPSIEMKITSIEEDIKKTVTMIYIGKCTVLDRTWQFARSYREFKSTFDDIKKRYNATELPQLPRKSVFSKKSHVTDQRKASLQELLSFLETSSLLKLDVVQKFLCFPADVGNVVKEVWDALECPIFEGDMEKVGGTYKSWKKRHVQCCADHTMRYYDPATWENGSNDKLVIQKGVIDLREITSLREQKDDPLKKFVLELTTKERLWKFACRNQQELNDWFAAVQALRENKAGFRKWLPKQSMELKTRSQSLRPSTIVDEVEEYDTKEEDLEALKQVVAERDETEREIRKIQTKIQSQASAIDTRRQNLEKSRLELESHKRGLRLSKDELQNINKMKPKLKNDNREWNEKLKERTNQLMFQYEEIEKQNKIFELHLENHFLKVVNADDANINDLHEMTLDCSPIVEGNLLKFRKAGRKKARRKFVMFVALSHGCYVEWTDSLKSNQGTTRMKLLGWSLDNSLVDSRRLKDEELDRLFILHGTRRLAVFLAESKEERNRWIDGFQRAKLCRVARV